MPIHSHSFYILRNREIDSLYFVNALRMFAVSLVNIFIPIYFYGLGIPIWAIFLFYFLRAAYFVVFSFLSLPLVRRLSDKMMIFLSIPFLILAFLIVNRVSGMDWFFFIAPSAFALYSIFFFAGYNLDFSNTADKEERGTEIGLNYVIMDITRFASPFLGGLLIVNTGFHATLLAASIILMVSIIPLFFFPPKDFSRGANFKSVIRAMKEKKLRNFRRATFGYVAEKVNTTFVWPLFIFLFVGSIEVVGEYVSFGLLAGAVAAYIAGRLSDKGKNARLFTITGVAQSLIWFVRTTVQSVGAIIGTHIGGYMFRDAAVSSWDSRYYDIIQSKKDPGTYVMAQEMYYNIARIITYPLFMLIAFLFTIDVFFPVSFALAGIFSLFYILAGKETGS